MADSAAFFLETAYRELRLASGSLRRAAETAVEAFQTTAEWVEYGDWLALAHRVGAQHVFFVNQDPVLVFAQLDSADEAEMLALHRRAWSLARPQCLFIAVPGELRVYSLSVTPARTLADWRAIEPLAVVRRAADVAHELSRFHRAAVESGILFEEGGFGDLSHRADQQLIADLRKLRRVLLDDGLPARHAHALIGRAIFIRYLEDRQVLRRGYFSRVAAGNLRWKLLLADTGPELVLGSSETCRLFERVLRSKPFTYALFEWLAQDFNGDMFPRDAAETAHVTGNHLLRLRGFLRGDNESEQLALFLWAYDFSVIPLELISSIYEEFYHESNDDDKGTHYTPQRLVSEVLSRALPPEVLATAPRILDPACGSGAFLVEAYKRIVRYQAATLDRPLKPSELRIILREQISGIDLNAEAVRVAAFSLYLALLNFQDPPSVRANTRLPNLLNEPGKASANHYDILYCANAFSPTLDERLDLQHMLLNAASFSGRAEVVKYVASTETLPFERAAFDVVIGNPPWEEATTSGPASIALAWADTYGKPVGDRSFSQLFVHRALALVRQGGRVALLLQAPVLFNQRTGTRQFREYLGNSVCIDGVVNFSQVRHLYFDRAVAPFVFVLLRNASPDQEAQHVVYQTARLTPLAVQLRAGVIGAPDRRVIAQRALVARDYLWKTYAWGGHRDAALMAALDMEPTLSSTLGENLLAGYGFQRGGSAPPRHLTELPVLSGTNLKSFGPLLAEYFEPTPTRVKRTPDERLYHGLRLVTTQGVKADSGVCARLESRSFSFRHTIYCIHLGTLPEWQAKVIVGIAWSKLGRYRMFMRAPKWGLWHDVFTSEDWLSLPIPLPADQNQATDRVCAAVDSLRGDGQVATMLDGSSAATAPTQLLRSRLDGAVFDLFGLVDDERDLVDDWERYSYDMLRNGASANALRRIPLYGAVIQGDSGAFSALCEVGLDAYLTAFVHEWLDVFDDPTILYWTVISPRGGAHLAVIVSMEPLELESSLDVDDQWGDLLAKATQDPAHGAGSGLYTDGMLRAVTDHFVLVGKRNERRLWTATTAREDAEATLLRTMRLQAIRTGADLG